MWRRRPDLSDEQGFALPTAIGLMAIGLLLGFVAIVSARELSLVSNDDRRTKQALAGADGGVQTALFRLNSLQATVDSVTTLDPCIVPTVDATSGVATALTVNAVLDSGATGYCTQTATEGMGNRTTFRYQMTPTAAVAANLGVGSAPTVALNLSRQIVATGTYTIDSGRTVTRRVLADVTALDGPNLLNPGAGGYAVVAKNSVSLSGASLIGLSARHAGVLSGGTLSRAGTAAICGNSVYSTGSDPDLNCAGVTDTQDAASAQALTDPLTDPTITGLDPITSPASCVRILGIGCNITGSTVTINGLPIGLLAPQIPAGKALDVCHLNISAGQLTSLGTATTPSYIFIRKPGDCGGSSGINITGTGQLCQNTVAVGICTSLVGLTDPRSLRILASAGSTITFNTNIAASPLPSYAFIDGPGADVTLGGSGALIGGVIAKTVTMSGNASIQTSPTVTLSLGSLINLPSALLPIYKVTSYKECSRVAPTPSDPTSGC